MKEYIHISTEGPYFSLFYNLAFMIALLLLIYEGHRRKFPMMKWMLFLFITWIFFIVGTKIITYSPDEWDLIFKTFTLPFAPKKSLLGGLLLGSVGMIAGKYFLRFRLHFLDAFALVLPLAIAIQRIGCFLTGCCYGKTSMIPWAVTYPVNTLPHYHHYQSGLISSFDYTSLPVHPLQLYEMTALLAGVLLLVFLRKSLKAKGSLFLCSMILIGTVRIIMEFLRAPLAHTIGGKVIWILNTTQWAILPVCFLLIYILVRMESKPKFLYSQPEIRDLGMAHSFWILVSVSAILWFMRNWFTYPEMLVLTLNVSMAVTFMGSRLIRNFYRSPNRWLYLASMVVPVVTMAQTVPENGRDSMLVKTYKTVSLGFGSGKFDNYHIIAHGEGCDRVTNMEYFEQKYNLTGAGFSVTRETPEINDKLTYGIHAFRGWHRETRISDSNKNTYSLLGISPYIHYDRKWIGIGGGVHLGNLSYVTENLEETGYGIPGAASGSTTIYPRFYARVGPERIFFVDYRFASHFPSALPGYRHQIGFGSGFGAKSGLMVRFGTTTLHSYLGGYIPLKEKLVLEPTLLWGPFNKIFYDNSISQYQFSLGLSYRFGHTKSSDVP